MWFAIWVTVLAASGNNIGKVLQKQATRTLPKLVMRPEVVRAYLSNTTWTAGMLTDLGGALLMLVAFANAPVSVVQPVSAVGLVVLLIFSHFYLRERLSRAEWTAAGVAFLGVVCLGLSAEPDHMDHPEASPLHILVAFVALVALLAGEVWWRATCSHPGVPHATSSHGARVRGGPAASGTGSGAAHLPGGSSGAPGAGAATDAALCGLEAGACFGLSAAACRTGFILAAKVGNTIVVCTMAAVSSMVSGVVAGFLVLEEKMPSGHGMKLVRLAAWACILLGVASLAGGRDGIAAAARFAAGVLPRQQSATWRYFPRGLARTLHKLQKGLSDDDEEGGATLAPSSKAGAAASTAARHVSRDSSGDGGAAAAPPAGDGGSVAGAAPDSAAAATGPGKKLAALAAAGGGAYGEAMLNRHVSADGGDTRSGWMPRVASGGHVV